MTVIEKSAEGSPENAVVLPEGWTARVLKQLECMERYLDNACTTVSRPGYNLKPGHYQEQLEEVRNLLAAAKSDKPLDPHYEAHQMLDGQCREIYDLHTLLHEATPVVETMARHWDSFPTPSISGTKEWGLVHRIKEALRKPVVELRVPAGV